MVIDKGLRARVNEELRKRQLSQADALAALAARSVQIVAARATEPLPKGASRFGGEPDVPPDFAWPRSEGRALGFLAQLDLSALPPSDLPSSGWLLFFYDDREQPWGFDPKDGPFSRVIYVKAQREALERRPSPEADPEFPPYEACALTFREGVTLPHPGDFLFERLSVTLDDAQHESYVELCEELGGVMSGDGAHHLLGHPQLVQNDMRVECELVTNGIYCGDRTGYESERGQALAAGAGRWRLLLQLDTDEVGPGWMWGDMGRLYFWIRDEHLKATAFERGWTVLQCG